MMRSTDKDAGVQMTPIAQRSRDAHDNLSLKPERVAYWYFRLNGFLQIENFVVHPGRRGSQRTDADLLGVRFPNRREFLFDHDEPMQDDVDHLRLATDRVDVVIAEIKTNGPCRLNGPWTDKDQRNVDRILAAIGCLDVDRIQTAATAIYEIGAYCENRLQIRLVAVARDASAELAKRYEQVTQLTWDQILQFIWQRFDAYRNRVGLRLKSMADRARSPGTFAREMLCVMGVDRRE
jgi:hypothetical protein